MSANFHEPLAVEAIPLPSDRSTGLVFTGAAAIGAYLLHNHAIAFWSLLAATGGFGAVSLVRPETLRPLNIAWFKLAMLLNRVVSPIVLLVLFCITIVPFGLAMQLVRDPLRRRRTAGATYWITRDKAASGGMANQF